VNAEVRFVVDSDILFHKSIDVQHLMFLYCWQYNLVQKYTDNALLGYTAAMVTLRRHIITYVIVHCVSRISLNFRS
jgi:hypothetical protein